MVSQFNKALTSISSNELTTLSTRLSFVNFYSHRMLLYYVNMYGPIRNKFIYNDYVLLIQLYFTKEDIYLDPGASVM